jgi:hypothetical protein
MPQLTKYLCRELDKNTVKNRELIIPVENTYKKRIFKIKSIDGKFIA